MLSRDELRAYCLSLRGVLEDFPFGEGVAVFKVAGKVFALLPVDGASISLKCDPIRAIMLRDTYPAVTGGYHLNKKHWNTIRLDGTVPDDEVTEMIEHSYTLVVNNLTKSQKQTFS